ncbi:hypothetical protein JVX92_00695 [Microbacterium hominis]|uniref:phage tail protein n=1 Tax=Microbacterium hominis TaxID=162426 RepID=UPI0019636606|nr:hypothetical protein [Microbacterium hominis]QRY40846.1 hypothetical protein JVX92_00695 [Microbacterium hominis]
MAKNTVVVSITSNIKGLQDGLDQAGTGLSKFGKAAGVAVAAAAAVTTAVGVKAVKSASDLEQAMGGMEAVFKDSSGQMTDWANKAANSVGLAKSEYANLSTILGAQLKNMGVPMDQLASQTNNLVGLGADLAAQFGGSTSDAVSALSSLLRGERDPIERYGVSMNEAAVNAKLAEMGLTGLSGEAEKNAKLQATLALLYAQTADAQGAFARESDTLAGAQQRLAAGSENLFATLGTSLLPAVTAVTSALGAMVGKVQESAIFQQLTGWLTGTSNAFADFIYGLLDGTTNLDFGGMFSGLLDAAVTGITTAADWLASGGASTLVNGIVSGRAAVFDAAFKVFPVILDALVTAIPAIVTGLQALIFQLAQALTTQAPIILQGAVTLFTSLLTAIVQILPGLIAQIVALLPVVLSALLSMIPALLQGAIQVFTAIVEALPVVIPLVITALVELLPKLVETVLGMIPTILDAAVQLFTSLVESLPIILPLLITAIIDLLPKIVQTVVNMIPRLIDAAVRLFTGLVDAIPRVLPQLIGALIGLAPQLVGAIIGLVPQLLQAGVNLIGGLVSGLWRAAGSVGSALLDIAKNAIGGFLSFLGIKSPSRLFMGYGKNVGEGLAIGLGRSEGVVSTALDSMAQLVGGFQTTLSTPDMTFASGSSNTLTGAGSAPVYNITVNTLKPSAETGREIVESIRFYESAGGRL